jgi:hypothetical protein
MVITNFIFLLIIVIIVFIVCLNLWNHEMVYVVSDIDNETYMVRDKKDKKQASNILATIKKNIYKITDYMVEKVNNKPTAEQPRYIKFRPYIHQLESKIKNVIIKESSENSVYTSYSINKGEEIVFCIRTKAIDKVITSSDIHDINLIMYVALHEISHVACPEFNHTPLFKEIFNFICTEAVELGIYKKIEFNTQPTEYCGMVITDSII